ARSMPSTDAATSTLVLPRAAARPTGPAGPERSAPPPNRVSADSGTSTPISNRVFLSVPPRGSARLPGAPQPTAGPQGQAGNDQADASTRRGADTGAAARAAGTAEATVTAAVTTAITGVRRAGHELRITGEGGGRGRVAVSVAVPVAVLAVVLLVLLADVTQVRRDL